MDETSIILSKKYNDAFDSTNIFVLKGESGIGKSYYVRNFLDSINEKKFIIKIDACSTEFSEYNTLNTTIYKLISDCQINKEISINILQKLALWIPRFGQKIAMMIDANIESKSINDLIRRAGINTEEPNVLEIMRFFESLSKEKPIVVYCDNIQWFDKGSWSVLLQLFSLIVERNWFCILSYTTNATYPILSCEQFDEQITKLKNCYKANRVTIQNLKRWDELSIKLLCDSILTFETKFHTDQYSLIYKYSQGVPLYVKVMLYSLKENDCIQFYNGSYITKSDWKLDSIHNILKDSIKNKISKVYKDIPESRKLLEFGSAILEDFSDESLNSIFKIDCFSILKVVEQRFRLIEYLFDNKLWRFEHFLVQDYIYHSLGDKAKSIHLQIANYLENSNNIKSNIKISLHYKLAGEYEKSAIYFIKEVESLLDYGCYQAALDKINYFYSEYDSELLTSSQLRYQALFLKGRIYFHIVQYQSAIEVFSQLIENIPCDFEELIGISNKWLARCYLKLSSQEDFNIALNHLQIAKDIFLKADKFSEIGDILLDFIVAYAHMNQKYKAASFYKEAEIYFNKANDKIGMLKLHRKCIIFMTPKLAAPILKSVAKSWERLKVFHEEIMSLNNAAVEYLALFDLEEVKNLLLKALSISIDLNGFGQVYIYNNLGILNIFRGDYISADNNFNEARKGSFRFVEQLIVDINKSALIALKDGLKAASPFINRAYRNALKVNENDYTIPATVNWGILNFTEGRIHLAIELLISLEPYMIEYFNNYIFIIWYNTVYNALLQIDARQAIEFSKKYKTNINNYYKTHPENYPQYALIPMEFWSEN